MNYTSIEQSKKLLELGLSPESADQYYYAQQRFDGNEYVSTGFYYHCFRDEKVPECGEYQEEIDGEEHFQYLLKTFGAYHNDTDSDEFIPCWSVGALLKMALVEKFEITPNFDGKVVIIPEFRDENGTYSTDEAYFVSKELIDACYEMVVWLLEHDYIKKNV